MARLTCIFIVGTGRSGTHFLCRLLDGFANTYDPFGGRENSRLLYEIAHAAIHHRQPRSFVRKHYDALIGRSPGILIDQNHPNLFFVDALLSRYEGSIALYPQRPTHQVVASMLNHGEVMGWYSYVRQWRQRLFNRVPFPNQMLGLEHQGLIESLPPHLLCTYRVVAHRLAFQQQAARFPDAVRAVDYESLVADAEEAMARVFSREELCQLGAFTLKEQPDSDAVHRYQRTLSPEQVAEIAALEVELVARSPHRINAFGIRHDA